jgi:hypothetical protein
MRFALQFASAVRQDFGFSGRGLSKIPIDIAPTIDPFVRQNVMDRGLIP